MAPQQAKKTKGTAAKVKSGKGKKAAPAPAPAPASDEDSNSSLEESEEEIPKPIVKKNKKSIVQSSMKLKQIANDDDDDDDDDSEGESSEDDSDGEEENANPPIVAREHDEDGDSGEENMDESSESDEDDSEDNSEEEVEDEEVNGKRKKAQKEKPVKKSKSETIVTLFIANLGRETEAKKLAKLFKKNNIEVKDARKLPNKTFGYVDLADPSDFDAAVALSGKSIEGQEIRVEKAKEKQKSGSTGSRQDEDSRTLFVKNLAESVTEAMLNDMFDDIDSIRMPSNDDGSHRGFAYIVFGTAEQATSTLEEKQGEDLEGQAIYLDRPRQKGNSFKSPSGGQNRGDGRNSAARGTSKVLFVRNLSFQLDESSLKQEFENSTSARIMTHADSGKPRGFGFVEFNSTDDATKAYEIMQGQKIMGREVFVDFASEKSDGGRRSFGGGRGRGGGQGRGGYGGGRGGGFRGGRGGRGSHKKF